MGKKYWPAAIASILISPFSCGAEPDYFRPQAGITMRASTISLAALKEIKPSKTALKFTVHWNGRAIDSRHDPIIYFHGGQDQSILHKYHWTTLETLHTKSSCSDEMIASLNGYGMGEALICDMRINMSNISLITIINKKGKKGEATSWTYFNRGDNISEVKIGFSTVEVKPRP